MGTSRRFLRKVKLETVWRCKYCGHKNPGLRGKEDESLCCENCGNQKSGDEAYDAPDDIQTANAVTDERLLSLANAGKNWECAMCGSQERSMHKTCSVCGSPRPDKRTTTNASPSTTVTISEPSRRHFNPKALVLAIVSGLAAIGGMTGIVYLCLFLFATHETTARVTHVSWQRTETLRQRETNNRESWDGEMPADAFNRNCNKKQRGTEKCNPHKCNERTEMVECNCTGGGTEEYNCHTERTNCVNDDNGSMTCDEERVCDTRRIPRACDRCPEKTWDTCHDECPVFDQWCRYDYYEWPVIEKKQASGTDMNPRWPGLNAGKLQRLEQTESYRVEFQSDIGSRTYHPSTETEFKRFPAGASYHAKYNRAGMFDPYERIE